MNLWRKCGLAQPTTISNSSDALLFNSKATSESNSNSSIHSRIVGRPELLHFRICQISASLFGNSPPPIQLFLSNLTPPLLFWFCCQIHGRFAFIIPHPPPFSFVSGLTSNANLEYQLGLHFPHHSSFPSHTLPFPKLYTHYFLLSQSLNSTK